ncbi:cell division topological specificity factor MinE [Aureimonas altamirensis]|jgi:cell division topological specificity factor|uniref:Cell division topological specificity factor n=1 Tax=Aureimonas altamirensis DSM 21988 TaxID=1121026 RepID=A0ABY1INQ7_9HYPH|nr:cell division topological specificity factor MinE [Aureimonas altamirensis]SHJ69056.1 cell division topological specificity factor MinE [Aureimonas altamirensis DSM 21988]
MNLFNLFARRNTAPAARERLQVLLAHERAAVGQSDLVNILREEILAVIAKHVSIDPEKVKVSMDRGDAISMLEVDIELPIAEPVMDREVRTAHG